MREERKAKKVDEVIMAEECPVGESQSNGEIEKAIQELQDQVRTVKSSLEAGYKQHVPKNHSSIPWLVRHASQGINRYQVRKDGRTAYERTTGKNFTREVAEFGECVWYYIPGIKGRQKMEPRWESGMAGSAR